MFRKKPSKMKALGKTLETFETIIGPASIVHGRIELSESLRVDGQVIGNIESADGRQVSVALGASGFIRGDIHAYRVLIAGLVEGNIYAQERVELHAGSEVRGDIVYGQIAIEDSAKLNGLMISRLESNIAAPTSGASS